MAELPGVLRGDRSGGGGHLVGAGLADDGSEGTGGTGAGGAYRQVVAGGQGEGGVVDIAELGLGGPRAAVPGELGGGEMPLIPVQFTRQADARPNETCGNRIQVEDGDGQLVGPANPMPTSEMPVDAAAADVNEPAANTAAVVTYAGAAGVRHVITGMAWSYYGGVPVGRITVQDAGATVFVTDIADEGCGFYVFPKPKRSALPNTPMVITLAAAGVAGVTGKLSILNHYTE